MKGVLLFALLFVVGAVLVASSFYIEKQNAPTGELKKFSSCSEIKNFLETRTPSPSLLERGMGILSTGTKSLQSAPTSADMSSEYSTTNIQVEGVDEADIVKNDGKYIYDVSGNKVVIVDAYPAASAKILSTIQLEGTVQEIFISKDRLVVFGSAEHYYPGPLERKMSSEIMPHYYSGMFVNIYDVSDRANPVLKRNVTLEGSYYGSRMIGDYVYVVANQPFYYTENVVMPKIGAAETRCADVYYSDMPDYYYGLTTILAVNTQVDSQDVNSKIFLQGSAQGLYVSQNNIYITQSSYYGEEKTVVNKVSIDNGKIEYKNHGEVPGTVLNQFSMDEYNGYFRIATTSQNNFITRMMPQVVSSQVASQPSSKNNVYVLDSSLAVVGKLEDLAPGEKIYSARFLSDRAYLVTFKKTDPLFVIDLKDPANPKILGKLKIPGYSNYLHPYDENHLIGIGKEAVEAEEGDFAWYQGVKLSLFDVTDVENPKEISQYSIGDRGTDSYALQDHKAFLFSKDKNLLVVPITLAEINKEQYPEGVPKNAYGEFTWQGAYVFSITLDKGFELKSKITHVEDNSEFMKSGYYFESQYSVKRSLYIGNTLYTLSDKMIKMNDLGNFAEINKVTLPQSV